MPNSPLSPETSGPRVLALVDPFVKGWPEHEDERAGVFQLADVLTGRFDSDVHYTAYECAVERRHTTGTLARADEAGVRMVAAVFDVDGPNHEGSDEWWRDELEAVHWLLKQHNGGFAYRTRGGYRLVFALPVPVPIRTAADAELWTRGYLAWCNYLDDHGIKADRRCKEWQRLYRAPHATRDDMSLDLETVGDPNALCRWDVDVDDWAEDTQFEALKAAAVDALVYGEGVAKVPSPTKRRDAVAKMLAAAWPSEGRHGAQLALAGALCHDGWSEVQAVDFLCEVCREAGSEERPKREKTVRDTYKAKAEGRPIQGWTALGGYVDRVVLDAARVALDPDAEGRRQLAELLAKPKDSPVVPAPAAEKRTRPSDRARRLGGKDVTRLKTGIATIDGATRGGILLRKFAVIGGAPGAGKTALMCKLAYTWLSQGVHVAVLASDEDADALLIRLGQLHGLDRDALESGDPGARDALASWCDSVPLILADGDDEDATVENVSKELRDAAAGGPSVLFVDSMQTARTGSELPKGADIRTRVNDAVRVLKRVAKVDGHLVLASSELAKAAYRNKAQADNINALSAFKESGDIEYGVSFALVLVTSPGTSDLVNAEIVKNRLGAGKPSFLLKLDHARANVSETAKEEQEMRDPLTFVKADVVDTIEKHGALTPNRIYAIVGGRKATVLKAIGDLLDAKKVIHATEGIRFPLPGEGGHAA